MSDTSCFPDVAIGPCYIPEIWTEIILYPELRTRVMTQLAKYVYGPTLCLWTYNMPTYSHIHMLTYPHSSFPTLDVN